VLLPVRLPPSLRANPTDYGATAAGDSDAAPGGIPTAAGGADAAPGGTPTAAGGADAAPSGSGERGGGYALVCNQSNPNAITLLNPSQ
jgi:hypothetical protein